LKHLEIHSFYQFCETLDFLPSGLETLVLNHCDDCAILKTIFPSKLKTLVIKSAVRINGNRAYWSYSFNNLSNNYICKHPVLVNLPASLEYLYINDKPGAQKRIKKYAPNVKIIYIDN